MTTSSIEARLARLEAAQGHRARPMTAEELEAARARIWQRISQWTLAEAIEVRSRPGLSQAAANLLDRLIAAAQKASRT